MNKKKYAQLDETGRVKFAVFESDEEAANAGFLPYEETEKPETPENVIPHNYTRSYEEQEGKIVLVWKAYPNYEAIKQLKEKLASTDYKVIKCNEASLLGSPLPYDMAEVHRERQEIRDEINRLEACE